jgi:hypothetical protein
MFEPNLALVWSAHLGMTLVMAVDASLMSI